MGARKKISSDILKKYKKNNTLVYLNKYRLSPRKIRPLINIIRGKSIEYALSILEYTKKKCSISIRKLLLSGIANWQNKNKNKDLEKYNLYIKSISVNNSYVLKRLVPSAQGRSHKIKKRFSSLMINISSKNNQISK